MISKAKELEINSLINCITKRDFFAAFAMMGLLSNPNMIEILQGNPLSEASIIYANDMLEELCKD